MDKLTLYGAAGSCSRVSMIVLEELGSPYEFKLIDLQAGEQKSPEYKRVNPKGKVPSLLVDGHSLTENPAMLDYLDSRFPGKGILPAATHPIERARHLADLCFCSATLHPLVSRIAMSHKIATPANAEVVWEQGCKAMEEYFGMIDERLSSRHWWYGDNWSAMDAYIYWVFVRVASANYDANRYTHYANHCLKMKGRPSVQAAIAREEASR